MHIIVNSGAVVAAAAQIGVTGEEAIIEYLGQPLAPVTLGLVALMVAKLPLSAVEAASFVS